MIRSVSKGPARSAWLALVLVVGCDGEAPRPVAPPSRPLDPLIAADAAGGPAPSAASPSLAPSGMKELVLVLPRGDVPRATFWEVTARQDASLARAYLSAARPAKNDPPSRQADLVREVIPRTPSAIVILPEDPKAVAPALVEARDRGISVLVIDSEVPVEGKPLRHLVYAPLEPPTHAMVENAIRVARSDGFAADDPALILANAGGDDDAQRRVELLKAALGETGAKVLPVAKYGGYFGDAGKIVEETLASHPNLAMVFADDDGAISSATMFRHDLPKDRRRFSIAGFAQDKKTLDLLGYDQVGGLVDLNLPAMAHKAIQVALGLSDGLSFPDRIEIPRPFLRATGNAKSPLPGAISPERMKAARNRRGGEGQ